MPWFQIVATFISGFVTAMLAKPLAEWLVRPRLEISLTDGGESVAFTPEIHLPTGTVAGHACYIRLQIRHRMGVLARGVQCFLTRIDLKLEGESEFRTAPFVDTQELAWASRGDECWNPMFIPRGATRYADIIATSTRHSATFEIKTKWKPLREVAIGGLPGTWRFTLLVAGENLSPREFKFELDWKNVWNDFELRAGNVRISGARQYSLTGSGLKPTPSE